MVWIALLCGIIIFTQLYFTYFMFRNHKYVLHKADAKCDSYFPSVLLTVPCKNLDHEFEKNISSFFNIDYPDFALHFVVESTDDPAYSKLCEIKSKLEESSNAKAVEILISGKASGCGQKNHNLLFSVQNAPDNLEVFAFADSDACAKPEWLSCIVYPLSKTQKYGASTGYRWFIPTRNNFASLALTALNAKVAQLLGKTRFNQAWGGSMAIRRETFYEIGLDKLWAKSISDDLTLSYALRKANLKIRFAPSCLVASYEETSWAKLFEFARRQFLITKVMTPKVWFFGLVSAFYNFAGLWCSLAAALVLFCTQAKLTASLLLVVFIVFWAGQTTRAFLRQKLAKQLLTKDADSISKISVYDYLLNPIWSVVILLLFFSSVFGRKITWRGITYHLKGPEETEIIS